MRPQNSRSPYLSGFQGQRDGTERQFSWEARGIHFGPWLAGNLFCKYLGQIASPELNECFLLPYVGRFLG